MKTNSIDARAWSPLAQEEIPSLRRAITAQLGEPMIASPMAPMMGDLLARLEGFATPQKVGALQGPTLPLGQVEPTAAEATRILHQALSQIQQSIQTPQENGQNQRALENLADQLSQHLQMKGEILARSSET